VQALRNDAKPSFAISRRDPCRIWTRSASARFRQAGFRTLKQDAAAYSDG